MPIEIKELRIKAIISPNEKGSGGAWRPEDMAKLKKEITKDVTEKVFRMFRQKNER